MGAAGSVPDPKKVLDDAVLEAFGADPATDAVAARSDALSIKRSGILPGTAQAEVAFAIGGADSHSATARKVIGSAATRAAIWKDLDVNGQGSVSLAELDKLVSDTEAKLKQKAQMAKSKGVENVPEGRASDESKLIDNFFKGLNSKPALFRAFADTVSHEGADPTTLAQGSIVDVVRAGRKKQSGVVLSVGPGGATYDVQLDPPPAKSGRATKASNKRSEPSVLRGLPKEQVRVSGPDAFVQLARQLQLLFVHRGSKRCRGGSASAPPLIANNPL